MGRGDGGGIGLEAAITGGHVARGGTGKSRVWWKGKERGESSVAARFI